MNKNEYTLKTNMSMAQAWPKTSFIHLVKSLWSIHATIHVPSPRVITQMVGEKISNHYLEHFLDSSRPPLLRFSSFLRLSYNLFMMSSGAAVVTCPRAGCRQLCHRKQGVGGLTCIIAATITCPRTSLLVRFGSCLFDSVHLQFELISVSFFWNVP